MSSIAYESVTSLAATHALGMQVIDDYRLDLRGMHGWSHWVRVA